MVGGNAQLQIAQFTSQAVTATACTVCFGFIPDFAEYTVDLGATNSQIYEWANIDTFDQWVAAARTLVTTGSSGNRTTSASGPTKYAGGDTVAAADVTAKTYRATDGSVLALGAITTAGITIPAALQVASGLNLVKAYRAAR